MLKSILRVIDSISERQGKVACWACVALIIVFVFEVTARYVFTAPTIWAHQTGTMLGATIAILGFSYAHRHNAHIRIDVLSSKLSPGVRAIIEVVLTLLFFFPLYIAVIYASAIYLEYSWSTQETLQMSYWYPPAWPIRALVLLGFCLFFLQGVANFVRALHHVIRRGKPA